MFWQACARDGQRRAVELARTQQLTENGWNATTDEIVHTRYLPAGCMFTSNGMSRGRIPSSRAGFLDAGMALHGDQVWLRIRRTPNGSIA